MSQTTLFTYYPPTSLSENARNFWHVLNAVSPNPNFLTSWEKTSYTVVPSDEQDHECNGGHPCRAFWSLSQQDTTVYVCLNCLHELSAYLPVASGALSISKDVTIISSDVRANLSEETIEYFSTQKIFNAWQKEFYLRIRTTEHPMQVDKEVKVTLNRNVLLQIATSAKQALEAIKGKKSHILRPINWALLKISRAQEVLSEEDYNFYLNTWNIPLHHLSASQFGKRCALNRVIIAKIQL